MEIKKTYLGIFTIEHKERRKVYRLFGHTIFRSGVKRRGLYDMKSILERYTGIKTKIKNYEIQHGWNPTDGISKHDLEKKIDFYFVWNNRLKKYWEENSNIPCYTITAPFVIYRRMNNIVKSAEAKGTIAYPSHSTHLIKSEYNIDEYCNLLRNLPEEFQPVTICLHHSDIEEYQTDKEYEKRGFKTVCASYNQGDKQFYEAFYDILKNYKYATSNEPGSYSFYAIEMGIPFFILGTPSITDNTSGRETDAPKIISSILDVNYGRIAYDLFSHKPFGEITQEQKDFVNSEIGITDGISLDELKKLFKKVEL